MDIDRLQRKDIDDAAPVFVHYGWLHKLFSCVLFVHSLSESRNQSDEQKTAWVAGLPSSADIYSYGSDPQSVCYI